MSMPDELRQEARETKIENALIEEHAALGESRCESCGKWVKTQFKDKEGYGLECGCQARYPDENPMEDR